MSFDESFNHSSSNNIDVNSRNTCVRKSHYFDSCAAHDDGSNDNVETHVEIDSTIC